MRTMSNTYEVTGERNQLVLAEQNQDGFSVENPVYDTVQINHIDVELCHPKVKKQS